MGKSWPEGEIFCLANATDLGSTLDLFRGQSIAFIAASEIGIVVLIALHWLSPKTGARPQSTFGLMLAGATGNHIDQIVFGHVIALHWLSPKTGARPQSTFGLMLAGATGNHIDQIVTDFTDIVPCFVFDVEDVSILIGLTCFAWDIPGLTGQLLAKESGRSQA